MGRMRAILREEIDADLMHYAVLAVAALVKENPNGVPACSPVVDDFIRLVRDASGTSENDWASSPWTVMMLLTRRGVSRVHVSFCSYRYHAAFHIARSARDDKRRRGRINREHARTSRGFALRGGGTVPRPR